MTVTQDHQESAHGRKLLRELSPQHRELRRAIPDVYQGFGALSKAAFADGTLDRRTKELIALAIGVVEGCDGCIASHAQAAVRAGASRQEAAEAIGVTFLMHGGPATIHGARAYEAFCEFADAAESGESPA
ncbi:carboxymuconolactone decarboxylase family protein [Nocardioides panacisoli]|uniref:Carboxymuconolactone decarboxylase family protein n=1 Tax=Nocardioides panacisoli TaxID=627624 RepID=A0ABP7IT32_9ACTN